MTPAKPGRRARGYKTFFMLNSAEHKILNAHTYKISRNSAFLFQDHTSQECYFSIA